MATPPLPPLLQRRARMSRVSSAAGLKSSQLQAVPVTASVCQPPCWHRQLRPQRRLARAAAMDGAVDAAGLSDAVQLFSDVRASAPPHGVLYTLETLVLGAAAYAAAVWPDRPRGWCFKELVEVRDSPIAGKGVFATVHIQAGTVLGAYPGRPRTPQEMMVKYQSAPAAGGYCFKTRSGRMLDPTDASGALSSSPGPGLPWPLPVDFTLAYVNEPPKGAGGTSVDVEDDPGDECGLLCVAARDISPGQEIFMDYGLDYDRSAYGSGQQQQQEQQDAAQQGRSVSGLAGGTRARQQPEQERQRYDM